MQFSQKKKNVNPFTFYRQIDEVRNENDYFIIVSSLNVC